MLHSVETDGDWRVGCRWSDDGSETRNAVPQESCVFRAPVLSGKRILRGCKDPAVPAGDSDRATVWSPEPAEKSGVCCLCRERVVGFRKARCRPDSKSAL